VQLSRTVAKNVERLRKKQGLSRAALVDKLNWGRKGSWTSSKLVNVEHGKGEDRAISVDEIYDLCRALDVTEYQLTLPSDEPDATRRVQNTLYGFDFEGDAWVDGIRGRQDLLSRLRWHPDVVTHTLPFWLEADAFSDFRGQIEDEIEDQYLPNLLRGDRDAQSDFIEDQRKIVGLKVNEWKRNEWPPPSDEMVNGWIQAAHKMQQEAKNRYRPPFVSPTPLPSDRKGIEVVPLGEEGDS